MTKVQSDSHALNIKTPEEKKSIGMFPYITFPVTSVCNNACLFCGEGGELTALGQDKHFNLELLIDLALTAIDRGISKFRLTGGEPFLHPDIGMILKFFSDIKVYTLVNTNGRQLTKHMDDFTELNSNIHVAVSLHTTNETAYDKITGTKNQFRKVIDGIEALKETGNLIRLNMVVTKHNRDELDNMINYCRQLGCGLKIHEIVDVPKPFDNRSSILVPISRMESELARMAEKILSHAYSEGFGIPCRRYVVGGVTINVKSLGHGSRYDTEGLCNGCMHMPCHEGLYDCYVIPDGSILPCRWGLPFDRHIPFRQQLEKAIEIFQRADYCEHEKNACGRTDK